MASVFSNERPRGGSAAVTDLVAILIAVSVLLIFLSLSSRYVDELAAELIAIGASNSSMIVGLLLLNVALTIYGWRRYRDAARHVRSLPYGRNSDRSDWRLVLAEGRGTCSTKHALLSELARENGRHVALVLGVYEMDGGNTPRIGAVLERDGLPRAPEAHCYLAYEGGRAWT